MPNIRYYFRLTIAFISRFKVILGLGVFLGVFVFIFFHFLEPALFGKASTRIGITGRYKTDTMPDFILSQVTEGLTKINDNGTVGPALASSWNTPDNGKTWVFTLNTNLSWQDGNKITANTINYDFSDVTVEKPNDKTIIYKLTTPYGAFPSIVSKPTFKKGFLGVGAWKVTNVSVSGGFVQQISLADKKENRKVYKFYPTEADSKLAFELGQVDKLEQVYDPTPFDSWKTVKIEGESDFNKIAAIFLNTSDNTLSSKALRQALSYAIDKSKLGGERAISPISSNSWVYNSQVKTYDFDQGRAKELLGELPKSAHNNLSIKLVTSPTFLTTANLLAKNWQDIGVKTDIQLFAGIPTEYQAFLVIFDVPKDPDQYVLWHSTQTTTNISHYQNPRIDKLLEDGRLEVDTNKRKAIYLDFQRFLLEDSPAIFLYYPTTYTISRK